MHSILRFVVLAGVLAVCQGQAVGYSILTHLAIMDEVWDESIRPILQSEYPALSAEDLRNCRAHAYGGALIQDMGYYPLGSKLFTDLTHYVRSGEFVAELLRMAVTPQELAFAVGSLAHYVSDTEGHPLATNRAVALLYPELGAEHGGSVTYEQSPSAHIKVEFGYDVLQVARRRYAPEEYHDMIGFEVAEDLLKRAFLQTYGLELSDVFMSVDLSIGTYRKTVSGLIPEATMMAWELKEDDLKEKFPELRREEFIFELSERI